MIGWGRSAHKNRVVLSEAERREKFGKKASIMATPRYYDVHADSGISSSYADPDCEWILLDTTESDAAVGSAIVTALSQSRFLSLDDREQEIADKIAQRERFLIQRYGYKSADKMGKETKSVGVWLTKGQMTLTPFHTDDLESFSGLDKDQNVIIPGDSSPEQIGAAFRLALSRCTSRYD